MLREILNSCNLLRKGHRSWCGLDFTHALIALAGRVVTVSIYLMYCAWSCFFLRKPSMVGHRIYIRL